MCGGDEGSPAALLWGAVHRCFFDRHETQGETAKRVGITQQYLSDIVRGRRRLSARAAALLQRAGLPGEQAWLAQAVRDFNDAEDRLMDEEGGG